MPTYDRHSGLFFVFLSFGTKYWLLTFRDNTNFQLAAGNSGIHGMYHIGGKYVSDTPCKLPLHVHTFLASRSSAGGPEELVSR
ncbi:hypothetical protein SMAC4_13678 [Sordaria macrospora]|uniref:uncharacterized protein n=1 Tax=Sordaria macrospora TaxID=5147 RepID=UPI002B2E4932|nr:hypothetical protein SMAC4_13678 [Sordaria macrospora]